MPAHRQRMTRLHRLDAVGALERKPDIGEVEDAHAQRRPWRSWLMAFRAVGSGRTSPDGEVTVGDLRRHARQRDKSIVGVASQLQPLAVHHSGAEQRHHRHVPPDREDNAQRESVTGRRRRLRTKPPGSGDAEHEEDRQGHEPALTERAGDGPRFDAAAHIHLDRNHYESADSDAARVRVVGQPARRQRNEPGDGHDRERRPEQEAMLRGEQHLQRMRRRPRHFARYELRGRGMSVQCLIRDELRQHADDEHREADERRLGHAGERRHVGYSTSSRSRALVPARRRCPAREPWP